MGKIEGFILRLYDTTAGWQQAEYMAEEDWLPVMGYVAGEWACHPHWRIPDHIRQLAWLYTTGIYTITHVPTGRVAGFTDKWFHGVVAVDRLAALPIRFLVPPTDAGNFQQAQMDPAWLLSAADAVGGLSIWYRGSAGRIDLEEALRKTAERLMGSGRASLEPEWIRPGQ